jgi:hypothetical protein
MWGEFGVEREKVSLVHREVMLGVIQGGYGHFESVVKPW